MLTPTPPGTRHSPRSLSAGDFSTVAPAGSASQHEAGETGDAGRAIELTTIDTRRDGVVIDLNFRADAMGPDGARVQAAASDLSEAMFTRPHAGHMDEQDPPVIYLRHQAYAMAGMATRAVSLSQAIPNPSRTCSPALLRTARLCGYGLGLALSTALTAVGSADMIRDDLIDPDHGVTPYAIGVGVAGMVVCILQLRKYRS